jgi:phosphopantothenoylcysteine decarboxylase/phosphopantothenate--cysteine ligase
MQPYRNYQPRVPTEKLGHIRCNGIVNSEATAKNIVIGVGGGIAAYKACRLVRRFRESGSNVDVLPTKAALKFVGESTWAALSGNPVTTSIWESVHEVPHVRLGQRADLVVVAPATADLIARAVAGAADDLLTSTLLTARCPVVFAPAMHTEMWEHPATVANVATLRSRGVIVIDPDEGRLTGADTGAGRLPEPEGIFSICQAVLSASTLGDLTGQQVVVSAGGTRESLDPVRYLGNESSGRMGFAVAGAAVARGAEVSVVAANVNLPPVPGATTITVRSAIEMQEAVTSAAASADVVVMTAAVADFRPARFAKHKIKKGTEQESTSVELVRNPDILAGLVGDRRPGQVIVGFAAETGNESHSVLDLGRQKLTSKRCDLLVVNDVSEGKAFGSEDNEVVILAKSGAVTEVARTAKEAVANVLWDSVILEQTVTP